MLDNKITNAMVEMFSALNPMGRQKMNEEAVVVAFRSSHRTLQQTFMRVVIVPILIHLADQYTAANLDGRNMASGRLASRMLENLNDDDLFLPFI